MTIECSDVTYRRLKNAALVNRCTIGQFAESVLDNYLRIGFTAPVPTVLAPATTGKKRSFQLSDGLFASLERFAGSKAKARRLIVGNICLLCSGRK